MRNSITQIQIVGFFLIVAPPALSEFPSRKSQRFLPITAETDAAPLLSMAQ